MNKLVNNLYYSKATLAPLQASVAFIIGKDENIIIDTGSSLEHARIILDKTKELSSNPITNIILTHHHKDHISGLDMFKSHTYLSLKTKELLENINNEVTIINNKEIIKIGEYTFEVNYITNNHSFDHIYILLKELEVLFIGDALMSHLHKGKFYFYEDSTNKLIKEVLELDFKYVHTGHQGIMTKDELINYFNQMTNAILVTKDANQLEDAYNNYQNIYGEKPKRLDKYFIDGFFLGKN